MIQEEILIHTLKGNCPVSSKLNITIRATQKKRMSWPVSNKSRGKRFLRSKVYEQEIFRNELVTRRKRIGKKCSNLFGPSAYCERKERRREPRIQNISVLVH